MIRDAKVGVPGALRPPQTSPYFGRLAAPAVTAVGGVGIALGVAQSSGPFGHTLVVAFVLVAPALAITRLLPGVNAPLALIVGAAGAAVINALVVQLMLSANAWSPPAGVIAVGLTAALLWLVPRPPSPAGNGDPFPSWSDIERAGHMTRVAIIGAGPYGLSIAAHLRSYGVPFRIFGTPLDSWRRHMPVGMMLKSQPFASSLSDPGGQGKLAAYCAERGIPYHDIHIPVSLDLFNTYALDFQQRFVEDLEERQVVSLDRKGDGFVLELDDGEVLQADFVVGAIGITYFGRIPPELEHLPANLMSHSSGHSDLSGFSGRNVTVIGAGSSAVDIATLLHEAGAQASVVARRSALKFTSPPTPGRRSRWQRICHPSSGLGPSLPLWLYEKFPNLFRYIPGQARLTIIRRVLGPQTPSTMSARFEAGVVVAVGESIEQASEEEGRVRLVLRTQDGNTREILTDHVIAATGYYPKVSSVDFLSEDLRSSIRTHAQMPMVSAKFESSVSGLYFVGLPAVNSFGPLMRFVVGAEYAAPRVARELARRVRRLEPVRTPKPNLAARPDILSDSAL